MGSRELQIQDVFATLPGLKTLTLHWSLPRPDQYMRKEKIASLRETIRSLAHRRDAAEPSQSEVQGQEVPAYEGGGGGSSSMGKRPKGNEPPTIELLLRQDAIEALLKGASAEEGRVWSRGDLSRGQRFRVLFRSVEAGEEM